MRRLSINHILLAAIFVSVLLHLAPVSYLVLTAPKSTETSRSIDVEWAESPAAPSTGKSSHSPAKPKAQSTQNAVAQKIRETALPANILGGGFHGETLSRRLSDETSSVIASSGVTSSGSAENENPFPSDPMSNVSSFGQGWSGAVQYGNSMGLKFTLESLEFFKALHARIDSQLIYPDDFSRQRITGKVRIEAELSRDGRLLRFTSTMADDRLLQTYCFAVLMQILSQPLPASAWLDTEKAIVAFDFDFHTRVRNNIPRTLPHAIEKNRLAFGRENQIDPLLNEKLSEIFTHYIPPIIPIPGGVYIDMVLAYQYVNNLMNGAPTESELREQRLTKLHQLLRMTIRTMGVEPMPSPTPGADI